MKIKSFINSLIFLTVPVAFSYANNLSPTSGHWCIDSSVTGCTAQILQDWKSSDIINQFYAQKTPLTHQIPIANNDKSMLIVPFVAFPTSTMPAEMSVSSGIKPQITFWQYLQRFSYFGGAESEGQVLAPQPGWIKAAHQNGVKILGCIFFSPQPFGGDKELIALNNMLNNPMSYVTQLVKIAKTLGFDGYFINNEADESTNTNNKFAEFIKKFHEEAKQEGVDLSLDWYQVPAYSADSLNKNLFVDDNGNIISDGIFLDYGWTFDPNGISSTVASWNYPLSKLDFGIYDVDYPTGSSHQWLYDSIFSNHQNSLGSVSEFAFQEILNPNQFPISFNQQLTNEENFWLGTISWKGASNYVTATTTISALPLSTEFNTGQGTHYFINGVDTNLGSWNDMGQQDVLPTWRFQIINESGNSINADFDYTDSYVGGSHLLIHGNVSPKAKTTIDLYAAEMNLSENHDGLEMEVISKIDSLHIAKSNICLYTTNNEKKCFPLIQNKSWTKNLYDLSGLLDKTINKLSIEIKGNHAGEFALKIGHLFIGSKNQSTPPSMPKNVRFISNDIDENGKVHHYISWEAVVDAKYYNIYSHNRFVGRTHQTIFDVIDDSTSTDFNISAVNYNNMESTTPACELNRMPLSYRQP